MRTLGAPLAGWPADPPGDRHSRRVARLKLVLPAIGLGLLVLVAVWPRLAPIFEGMRLGWPAIDLRDAGELRMLNPRYAGSDRQNRPFLVTAAVARQAPDQPNLMSLDAPRANLKTHGGAAVVVTANSGVYQSQAQLLDLFGAVTLVHENGTRFETAAARLDIAGNAGEGHDPIEGHGPSGDIKAQGFRILDKGNTIIFTGKSDLLLNGAKMTAAKAAEPAAVPRAIAASAAQVEARAKPMLAAAAAHRPAAPRAAKHKAKPHPAAHRQPHPHAVHSGRPKAKAR